MPTVFIGSVDQNTKQSRGKCEDDTHREKNTERKTKQEKIKSIKNKREYKKMNKWK